MHGLKRRGLETERKPPRQSPTLLGAAYPVVAGAADAAAQVSQSRGLRVSATRPTLLSSSR
jgi:hypothetical protein